MPELTELEQQLRVLAAEIEWPATPALGAAVSRRITAMPRSYDARPWYERRPECPAVDQAQAGEERPGSQPPQQEGQNAQPTERPYPGPP